MKTSFKASCSEVFLTSNKKFCLDKDAASTWAAAEAVVVYVDGIFKHSTASTFLYSTPTV